MLLQSRTNRQKTPPITVFSDFRIFTMGKAKADKTVDKGRFSRLLQKQAVGDAPTSVAKKRELPKTMEALQNIGLRGNSELKAKLAVAARSEGTRSQHNRVLKDLKDYMVTHGVSPRNIDDDIIIGFLLKAYADEKSFSYIRLVSFIVFTDINHFFSVYSQAHTSSFSLSQFLKNSYK